MKDPRLDFDIPTITNIPVHARIWYRLAKRTLDIAGALAGILLLLFFTFFCSFFYLRGANRGPLFFKQKRIGQQGKEFDIYKFRSMVCNAEEILKKDEVLYRKYVANNYKIAADDDPRITAFGKFIRKTSLDELPQFINVLKGDMSLVGPRPLVKAELSEYHGREDFLLSVKPGITGYWQVCGRSDVHYPERADIELFYVRHQCLLLDVEILYKTILLVLKRTGAY